MSAHDVLLGLIYQVPAIAFGIVALLTIALPLLHSILVVGRVLSGRPANIDWWVIGRVLPLIVAIILLVPLSMAARNWTRPEQVAAGEVALIYLSAGMIFLPIALPLLQAYSQRLPRWGTFIYAILAMLAVPVAAALATQSAITTTNVITHPSGGDFAFALDPIISQCKQDMFAILPEGYVTELPRADADGRESYAPYFFFWVDMTFKAAFLDFFETFDCGLTNLRHNPNHILMSSLVFIYRAFVSLIVLTVITLPFRRGRE
jgi:hypothetical protein